MELTMSYNDFLGIIHTPEKQYMEEIESRTITRTDLSREYDFVRYGLPRGVISFEKTENDRNILLRHYYSQGYSTWPASKIGISLKRHVALLRASLDLWEEFAKDRVFSKEEIYVRSLKEGPAFTEYIKKCRSTSLRAYASETDTSIDEDYFVEGYSGYNSIIHERYLIHWDDTKDIDDVKYAFLPKGKERKRAFRKMVRNLFSDMRIEEENFPESLDMLGILKNTKMYDPVTRRTALMREFWGDDIDTSAPYFARRTVVPTDPGSTRDTGVGDPGTILKVKQLNALARVISERLPYSANCSAYQANSRYRRVLRNNAFLHLDFKKFGLTFPRYLMNVVIEEIGRASKLDTSHLLIEDFFVEIDKEVYATTRGTMLGWLDSINSICVCAILHNLSNREELGFDFITFNDDVEISKRCHSDIKGTLELLRMAVITELDSFDIPISIDKTYGSKGSVFLERYAYFGNYGLDMYKEQLTVASYAKSLVTEYPWKAKLFFSAAELWTKSTYATDRCIDTCPIEFRKEEITLPVWAGGWYLPIRGSMDYSLQETDAIGYYLGLHLSNWRPQKYSTRREYVSSNEKIWKALNERAYQANSAELGAIQFNLTDTLPEINVDVELIRYSVRTLCDTYLGRNVEFPLRILQLVENTTEVLEDPP